MPPPLNRNDRTVSMNQLPYAVVTATLRVTIPKRPFVNNTDHNKVIDPPNADDVMVVIGAGPHALSLLLRLLEPDADLLSDKDRHIKAEYRSRMRPLREVDSHLNKFQRGPVATLKQSKREKKASKDILQDHRCLPKL